MSLIDLAYFVPTVAIVTIALIFGRKPERLSAVVFLIATLATQLSAIFISKNILGNAFLFVDGLMAFSFLIIALRYGYMWIALLMVSMSGYFGVHAFYLMTNRRLDETFALMNNLATGVALLSLTIGVWTSRHRKDEWH
ncbi:MAG: hypothetical protein ACK5V0_00205 [Alphaproteobacteria bacterium]|jgi:hypothetical protein